MEVHRVLGHGFLEAVYHESLAIEFQRRNILFTAEVDLPLCYKGVTLHKYYRADFVVFGSIIVEIKALDKLTGLEEGQVMNYLKASGLQRALLINFGARSLQYQRIVWEYQ